MGLFSLFTRKPRSANDPVNITSAEFKANPYPFYARLRAEAPVYRVVLPTGEPVWLVTRYEDVVTVLKDERFAKNASNALTPDQLARQHWSRKIFKSLQQHMLDADPPDHTRLRGIVRKAFTPRLVEQMRDRIQRLTDELLDRVRDRDQIDLIHDVALPIPTTIIAEMLGVPVEDRHRFHRWSKSLFESGSSTWSLLKAIPNIWAFQRYVRVFTRKRRAHPQDDLTSALIQAEEAGDALSEAELVAMVFLLLVAGHETTVNLIGNGTLALLEHPDQLERLRADPGLIEPAVEELLRYASPVETATERFTRADVSLGGVTIPRGEIVFPVLASANRDERQFPDPDRLDITREPNRHLAFGLGAHFCLGAPLARLEGQIAIGTLLRRVPGLRLAVAPDRLRWRSGLIVRGLEALPVAVGQQGSLSGPHRVADPVRTLE